MWAGQNGRGLKHFKNDWPSWAEPNKQQVKLMIFGLCGGQLLAL